MARNNENSFEQVHVEVIDDEASAREIALPHQRFDSSSAAQVLSGESLKQVIENYLRYYASGGTHTARAKRYDLQHFLIFLSQGRKRLESVRVSEWTLQATKDFVDHRLGLGEAPATVGRRLATVKHLGRTLAERVSGYINPAREVKTPVVQQTRPNSLSAEEIHLLRQAAESYVEKKRGSFSAKRNQFLLEILLGTGLRADEVRVLTLAQISDDREWLKNVKTKGRKYRNVYLDSTLRPLLDDYLSCREQTLFSRFPLLQDLPQTELRKFPVFVSLYEADVAHPSSFGLSPKSIWRIISALGRRAQSLSRERMTNLHPHKLRHTFAHGLLNISRDVRLVAQALGHSDVRTTMRYTERTDEEIAKAIEAKVAAHPHS